MLTIKEQIFKQIERARSILLVFPVDWEADSVSASLGLFLSLKKMNKNVDLVASKPPGLPGVSAGLLSFLPGSSEIKNKLEHLRRFIVSLDISHTKVSQIKYIVENDQLNFIVSPEDGWFEPGNVSSRAGEFRFDLIISLGADDLESLGEIYDKNIEFFYKTPLINISCRAANEEFGQINFIDLASVTISEIIFKLLKSMGGFLFDENIATNLLAGIILKTKNFKTALLTPEMLMTTSELIQLGARREEIINQLYRSRQISDLKLWGKVLTRLTVKEPGEVALSFLKPEDLVGVVLNETFLRDLIDELMTNLPNTKIILIIAEKNKNESELFAFSLKGASAIEFLRSYSPFGNFHYAQALVEKSTEEIIQELFN